MTGVILPAALGGIVTATILAGARAAGETAPLIFLSSIAPEKVTFNIFAGPVPNIPIEIFKLSEQADPAGFDRAWGAAFGTWVFAAALWWLTSQYRQRLHVSVGLRADMPSARNEVGAISEVT